jgi:hypothetical protein
MLSFRKSGGRKTWTTIFRKATVDGQG